MEIDWVWKESAYGSIPNAFAVGLFIYGFPSGSIRSENTDDKGNRANVTQTRVEFSYNKRLYTTEIKKVAEPATYAVFLDGTAVHKFEGSRLNFIVTPVASPVWVGITASDGDSFTSFTLHEFQYIAYPPEKRV